jgi:hypothetical protein
MVETIEGEGRLETITPPEKVWMVSYHFDITTNIVEKSGFPRVASKRDSTGTVRSLDGKPIPEGTYQLHAGDGEILRVENAGFDQWAIVAS